jgi:hypothetical protein
MEFRYLYIDDNSKENALGIITGLDEEGLIKIDFDNPKGKWEEERARLISEEFKSYDGLILDLNLEEMPNMHKVHSLYKGSSLAQEIRNVSKAGEIKEIPIVLLSATINLNKYFDKTNEDLFDLIISRDQLSNIYIETRQKLLALADGYRLIEASKAESNYNNLFQHDLSQEDVRLQGEIKSIGEFPIHTVANFIIKNLLNRTGVLISEEILATRLGINVDRSDDWPIVKKNLERYEYKGAFHVGWKRWWMSGIDNWWNFELHSEKSLRSIDASARIALIKSKLDLQGLSPIIKAEKSRSSKFWTNCVGSGVAIDTIDGLAIANQDNLFPWQDRSYVSVEEALRPTGKEKWKKISPSEEFKLIQLRKLYPNERIKG